MTVIHGDNLAASRRKLQTVIDTLKTKGQTIVRLEAAKLAEAELEQYLGEQSLFGSSPTIVIEELHSLPNSNRKTALLKQVVATTQPIILWEKKSLTKPMLTKLNATTVFECKISRLLFKWLSGLRPQTSPSAHQLKLFHQVIEQEDVFMCLALLVRQFRLLIQAKHQQLGSGPAFAQQQLRQQAQAFSESELLTAYQHLLEIERGQKTGSSPWTITQELDLFLLKL